MELLGGTIYHLALVCQVARARCRFWTWQCGRRSYMRCQTPSVGQVYKRQDGPRSVLNLKPPITVSARDSRVARPSSPSGAGVLRRALCPPRGAWRDTARAACEGGGGSPMPLVEVRSPTEAIPPFCAPMVYRTSNTAP